MVAGYPDDTPYPSYLLLGFAAQPGFLAPASFNIGGKQYVVAQLPAPFTFNLGGAAGTQTLYTAVHQ